MQKIKFNRTFFFNFNYIFIKQVERILKIGILLSSCEIKVLYNLFDKNEKGKVPIEDIMKFIDNDMNTKVATRNADGIELVPMKLKREGVWLLCAGLPSG